MEFFGFTLFDGLSGGGLLAVAAVIFVVGLALTIKGGDWFVDSASWFAEDLVVDGVTELSKHDVGALIVFERETKLGEIISTGTIVNADPSKEIIGNIFFHNAPMHDGATIIRGGRIYASGCFLPLSQNYDISNMLGTRHRAAIGMSEQSDAVVVIVSEETGIISIARAGKITRYADTEALKKVLAKYYWQELESSRR